MKNDILFLQQDAVTVAKELIGWQFHVTESDNSQTGGTIIETEAYSQDDAASHSYRGKTNRNEVMFGAAGLLYVYFTYGMHWCANVVTGPRDHGEAVLIRAITPTAGIDTIRQRRHNRPDKELTDGPAKVCQALDLTGKDNGLSLNTGRVLLSTPSPRTTFDIQATERIGIRNDTGRLWRFVAQV